MKKIIIKESDIQKALKEVLKEEELKNYMFFQNLKEIKQNIDELLSLNETEVDNIISNGHDWAAEHITTAKDDIEEVTSFLVHGRDELEEGKKKGLWDNIHAKRKRGEKPAKPGDEDYPSKKAWDKVTKEGISEGLDYHIKNKIPLVENVYRYGSKAFFNLINEARDLYNEGKLKLSKLDKEVINSDIGKQDVYEGEVIYLDFPLTEEENKQVNSPKKSGSQNYVYVKGCLKDKSKVKKMTYGSAMRDKLKDPDRRKAYASRHGCEGLTLSKDKCTKKYWACRKPKDFAGINAWW
jgi:hypothetical protein